jgi:hypothetical protein
MEMAIGERVLYHGYVFAVVYSGMGYYSIYIVSKMWFGMIVCMISCEDEDVIIVF